jgi:hypothetical protein
LWLEGVNRRIFSDSTGEFSFDNLIPGQYVLRCGGVSVNVEATAGKEVYVDTVMSGYATPDFRCAHEMFVEIHEERKATFRKNDYVSLIDPNTYFVNSDMVEVVIFPELLGNDGTGCRHFVSRQPSTPCDSAIDTLDYFVITVGTDTLHSGPRREKNRDIRVAFSTTGNDTVTIRPRHCPVRRLVILGETAIDAASYVRIFGVEIATDRESDPENNRSRCSLYVQDSVRAYHSCGDKIDWDLRLVRVGSGDTCWWRNPSIDWGDTGFVRLTEPSLPLSDEFGIMPPDLYPPDEITGELPAGTYRLYVTNYSRGESGKHSDFPSVTLFLKNLTFGGMVDSIKRVTGKKNVGPGDRCFLGTISSPNMVFHPSENVVVEDITASFSSTGGK